MTDRSRTRRVLHAWGERVAPPGSGARRSAGFATALLQRYGEHRVSISAGGIAFFAALALAPLAVAIGAIAGLFIDPDTLRQGMATLIADVPAAAALEPFVNQLATLAQTTSVAGFTITGVISLLVALFAASRVVAAGRQILDVAFDRPYDGRGLIARLAATLTTLLILLAVLALTVAVTLIPAIMSAIGVDGWLVALLRGPLSPIVTLALCYVVVRGIYDRGPRRPLRIGWWSPGAAAASAWLVAVGIGLDVYVSRSATWGVTVAVLGGAAILLLWLYFCALGLVVGAEAEGLRMQQRAGGPKPTDSR